LNATWSTPAHEKIGRLVHARTGLIFGANRVTEAEAGIKRAMDKTRMSDVSSYLRRLEFGGADLDVLVGELTVTETYFFREPAQFEFIRTRVLPPLVPECSRERLIRIWSAGCASGEEAYSLAILLDQCGLGDRAHVLATDISRKALVRARDASYAPWSFRGVDSTVTARYFRAAGNRQVLDPRIRERVRFERLNLALDTYPSFANGTWRLDLILCRNVLIYFDHAVVQAVGRRFLECLAPQGWLIMGSSDPPINEDKIYESVVTPAGVFYRRRSTPGVAFDDSPPSPLASEGGDAIAQPDSMMTPPPRSRGGGQGEESYPAIAREADDPLPDAKAAFDRGEYDRALELAQGLADPGAAAFCVRALANTGGPREAERAAGEAATRYPLAPEIHLLRSVLLLDLNRTEDAIQAAKRALYLDRTLSFGHFVLGLALSRLRDVDGARRAFRNAHDLCARQGPDEAVAFSDGQRAGRFVEAVTAQLDLLAGETAS
jgi:chemotaxis protein methyltransferase CheR